MTEGAEDRTEAATPRRLEKARSEGQVALSPELAPAAVLGAAAIVLATVTPTSLHRTIPALADLLADAHRITPEAGLRLAAWAVLLAVAPFALGAAVAGSVAVLGQTGLVLDASALRPGFSRLSPLRNLRRIAGPDALLGLGKALVKAVAAGGAVWWSLGGSQTLMYQATSWTAGGLLGGMTRLTMRALVAIVSVQTALALLDVLRARWSHARRLRMTRQEIREEFRESEGDPHVKARVKRLRRQRARRRMLSAVPTATVVITNPTHYAVALAYERGGTGAPRVVAKGVDALAARIRDAAQEARVPIVANPPLARALWRVELDAEIPSALFQAVAEIIAYVWRLRTPAPRAAFTNK